MPDLSRVEVSGVDLSWINGREQNAIAVTDRGLQYGDGLFETLLYLDNKTVLQKEHLARLQRDAQRLYLHLDFPILQSELNAFLNALKNRGFSRGIIKILVTREFTGRGYGFDPKANSHRLLQFFSGVVYPKAHRKGIAVTLLPERLSLNPALAGIKHLNRIEQVRAQYHVKKPLLRGIAYSEGLLLDSHQAVTEGVYSNVFMVKNWIVTTPLLDRCGVRGVMRDYILQSACKSLKIPAKEARISLADLLQADEIFLCNSVYGIWPLIQLDTQTYPLGSITQTLQEKVDTLGYEKIHA